MTGSTIKRIIEPIDAALEEGATGIVTNGQIPVIFPTDIANQRLKMDGLKLLSIIPNKTIKLCVFDPQYRGILDKQRYGNEGISRGVLRCSLPQMDEKTIVDFIKEIERVLIPSGHLFLWVDKFHLCEGIQRWIEKTELYIVDLVTWEKTRIGMGYRTRRKSEYLLILQKSPKKAKGVWTIHNIPDVIADKADTNKHPHAKPVELQMRLIEAVTLPDDYVLDPAMGSGSIFDICKILGRKFIGCDING